MSNEIARGSGEDCFNFLVSIPRIERSGLIVVERSNLSDSNRQGDLMRLISVQEFISMGARSSMFEASRANGTDPEYYLRLSKSLKGIIS